MPAVRRPAIDVDGALAAQAGVDIALLAAIGAHEAQDDVLVRRVAGRAGRIADEDDGLSVGRDMREPVDPLVEGQLFDGRAVRLHAEALRVAGYLGRPLRAEIDEPAVR